jgi:hypothetical protein
MSCSHDGERRTISASTKRQHAYGSTGGREVQTIIPGLWIQDIYELRVEEVVGRVHNADARVCVGSGINWVPATWVWAAIRRPQTLIFAYRLVGGEMGCFPWL